MGKIAFSMGKAYKEKGDRFNVKVLYWLAAYSWYDGEVRRIDKGAVKAKWLSEDMIDVSRRGVKRVIERLIELGYLEEMEDEYIVYPKLEKESFITVDEDLAKEILKKLNRDEIKGYLYLARLEKMGRDDFTKTEVLKKGLGKGYGNSYAYGRLNDVLESLKDKGYVDYHAYSIKKNEIATYRQKLTYVRAR